VLRDDVATVTRDEPAGEAARRIEDSPYGFALVLAPGGTLLGRLRRSALESADADAPVEQLMEAGPSTVRADSELEPLVRRLRERDLRTAVVTTPEGRLLGVMRRAEAEERLA
jgi:Mg/Co/Ni transporter MgtE